MFGSAIGWLELQRPLASMVRQEAPDPARFGSERVDFALDIPGSGTPVRLVIELDGPHHDDHSQRAVDENRDDLLRQHGWQTARVPIQTLNSGLPHHLAKRLEAIIQANPFPFTHIQEGNQALEDPLNREITRLVLTPHAVARVQLGLSRALLDGWLNLQDTEWVVAVVEREVPCAELAVQDWLQALHHLCRLYDIPVEVERVRLLVSEEHTIRFPALPDVDRSEARTRVTMEQPASCADERGIDLAIDVSVGCHPTRKYSTNPLSESRKLIRRRVSLRTAQRQSGYQIDPWPKPRAIAEPLSKQESLEYFLRTLFRKECFRSGQLEIMDRVLRREDVIGLLPTGAGKSISFQLPALLSPGLSLVVDPIKSLMQDQVENLEATGVMDAIQINSDTPAKERPGLEWQLGQGEFRMVFISPERLQIKKFRELLQATAGVRPIAFVVIDEAHCVSEWGHDFRTAYLNLGRIAADSCGEGGVRPPLVALTGTASESVLRDIQRELGVDSVDAIVRPGAFARDELKFEIVPVPRQHKLHELTRLIGEAIPEKLGVEPDLLASGACGGIVFCPHVDGKLGVFEVASGLSMALPQFASGTEHAQCPDKQLIGFYSGEPPDALQTSSAMLSDCKVRIQRAFKAGRMPLLVATSAFGMGIDKPNIRYTIHYAMAKSVEAFAQEAGRAGRDRHDAICAILFTDRLASRTNELSPAFPDCLESGISTEEAQARAAASGFESDDAELQMYLHTRSYQGIRRESAAVRALYHHWIEPLLPLPGERSGQLVETALGQEEFRESIESLMAPLLTVGVDEGSVPLEQTNNNSLPRPDLQRLIYRLSLLGIISDYTVSYHPGNNVYALSVRAIDDAAVIDHLNRYVGRYRTSEHIRAVEDRRAASSLQDSVCQCIDTLCWFIYEEIEKRRRQAMENMRQMLRESADGAGFGRRIDKMLSFTALTRTVFDVLRTDDHRDWSRISVEITAAESAERVYYQCRRALEDAPGHPGLLLLLALSLLGMEEDRHEDAVANFRDGMRQARQAFSGDVLRSIADWIVLESARIAPVAASRVLDRVVRLELDTVLAGAILRARNIGRIATFPDLQLTCQRCLLHSIDNKLTLLLGG